MNNKPKVVQQDGAEEIPVEVFAQSLIKLDGAVKKMFAAGLKREAIVTLLWDASGVGKPAIRLVLTHLDSLRKTYCTR